MKGKNLASGAAKLKGNASKATLPNGEKLSNKIQQNKVNQGVNGANKQKNNNANKKDSKNGKDKEKQEGKGKSGIGLPDVQSLGTEAAKEALKKAAGAIPYTKWIPKGIRDKIIDKFMDSDAGQAAVEKGFKQVRTSIIIGLVGIVASLVMLLLQLSAVATLIMSPLAWIADILEAVGEAAWSFGNFVLGNGWCTDEQSCSEDLRAHYYSTLDVRADEHKSECGVELNTELITATVFYDRMVSKKHEDVENGQFEEENIEENTYYKYTVDDPKQLDILYNVYRNQGYKSTCPTDIIGQAERNINNVVALFEGKFTADDLDNLIIEQRKLPTVAEIEELIGRLSEEETTIWNEFRNFASNYWSCFEGVWDRIKSIFRTDKSQCQFNEENYKKYLMNNYIPTHYNYLTGSDYGMSYEEIADEILRLGKALASNAGLTKIENTDGLFTMLPADLSLRITSNPANCRCHPTERVYQSHKGLDIGGAPYGTPILAFEDGVVESTHIATSLSCGSSSIKLKHTTDSGTVYYTRYVHLNRNSNNLLRTLSNGTTVSKGQVIGYVGGTTVEDSCSTGPHLHFEFFNSENKNINPAVALNNYANGIDVLANQELITGCPTNGASC